MRSAREAGGVKPLSLGRRVALAALQPNFVAFVVCSVAVALLFVLSPELDLDFQALFFRDGEGFYLKNSAFAVFFYDGIRYATPYVIGLLVVLFVASLFKRARAFGLNPRVLAVLALTLAIGPGIIVNAALKDNWGRARPSKIVEFGGAMQFTPAFVISDQCDHNCSFVAGHPSMMFSLFAAALMLKRRRRLAVAGVAALGGLAGLGRIMQGGHFLSDVIFSGVFVYLVAWLLVQLLIMPEGKKAAGPT